MYVWRQLKRVRPAVLLWRLLKKTFRATPYYALRFVGQSTFPIIGRRAPLRGYYRTTREFLRHGNGYCADLSSPSETGDARSSDEFKFQNFVAVIPNGRSIYDCGVVVSPDHKLLADVSWSGYGLASQPREHFAMHRRRLPPVRHIVGKVAVITSIMHQNYYHWMFDILPRFKILQRSGLVPDYYSINTETSFQRESLQVLGISSNRILSPTKNTHIEADELIIPSLLGPVFSLSPQAQACQYLQSTFLRNDKTRKPHRKLYISRNDANNRRVINETELRDEVLDKGFEVISLSGVSLLQQVELFSEAKIIMGPHGAGFTNAVFCQPGSVLIEFLPEGYNVDCFERLARLVGMEYHAIMGTAGDEQSAGIFSYDHNVDIAALTTLIRKIP
jgi:hypothetical protein